MPNTKRPGSIQKPKQIDSTRDTESLKPDPPCLPLDSDATYLAAAAAATTTTTTFTTHPLTTAKDMDWDASDSLDHGQGSTRTPTEELDNRTLALGFQFDNTNGRIPSWSETVCSSASIACDHQLADYIRYISGQFSRSSLSNQGNGEDSVNLLPFAPQSHPTLIPLTNRPTSSLTRSTMTSHPLSQSIGLFGVPQKNNKFSPPSPVGKAFQPVTKSESATREIVLLNNVTNQDVLFDLTIHANHQGNKELDQKITKICEIFKDRPLTDEERGQTISRAIVDWTRRSGGRFLKPLTENNIKWTVMSYDEAVNAIVSKVTHGTLRYSDSQVVVTSKPPTILSSFPPVPSHSKIGSTPSQTQENCADFQSAKTTILKKVPVVPKSIPEATQAAILNDGQILSQEGDLVPENDITEKDVLFGRGGKSNHHPGNKWYRQIIAQTRPIYSSDTRSKVEKTDISNAVVNYIQSHGGRFLKRNNNDSWAVMKQSDARRKAAQLLRETKVLKWTKLTK